jgi:site-specific DNA-methyltransferase (adenine-specific)
MMELTIGDCRIINGDCFDVLKDLDITSDAVITDMPFGITSCDWDKAPPPPDKFWEMVEAKSKQTANYVLFGAGKFTVDLINSNRKAFRYDLIWSKNTKCGFLNANLQPLRSHESILIFNRPGEFKKATYNALRTPGGRIGMKSISRKTDGVYGAVKKYVSIGDGYQHPSSVLCFNSDRGNNQRKAHPTGKPVQLLEWLILTYTNPGDMVLDPFMGSATTALACIKHNRRFIGIEQSAEYYDMAVNRAKQCYDECAAAIF